MSISYSKFSDSFLSTSPGLSDLGIEMSEFSDSDSQACAPNSPSVSPAPSSNEQVVHRLSTIFNLTEIKGILQNSQGVLSLEKEKLLAELIKKLPVAMQQDFPSHGSLQAKLSYLDQQLQGSSIKASRDLGGHGGTFQIALKMDNGETRYLFLKPKDGIEALNYKIIDRASQLSKWMPTVYGEIEKQGKTYLIMENVRLSPNGSPLMQLVDAKLAGKVPGLENPIASKEELAVTQRTKSFFDFKQMQIGANQAPGYMIASGHKLARLFNYKNSQKNLFTSLAGVKVEHLKKLQEELVEIKKAILAGSVALIGSSIILIKNEDGSIKPLLIDPAHIQVDPQISAATKEKLPQSGLIFYGNPQKYERQKQSNVQAINSLYLSINELILSKAIQAV